MLNCHFSWQAQYSVKFGMIAGAGNVVFFNRKCAWRARKVTSVARRVAADGFLLGSFSDHSRIGPALEMTFQMFSRNFFEMLESHFAWQAQYSPVGHRPGLTYPFATARFSLAFMLYL